MTAPSRVAPSCAIKPGKSLAMHFSCPMLGNILLLSRIARAVQGLGLLGGVARPSKFVSPPRPPQQTDHATHLRSLFTARWKPGHLFLQSEAVDHDCFLIAVLADAFGTVSSAEATVLDPAHGSLRNDIIDQTVVDTHRPGVKTLCHLPGFNSVATKYNSVQPVPGVISEPDGLIGIGNFHDWDHGAECFILYDAHIVGHVNQHSQIVIKAPKLRISSSAGEDRRAFVDRVFDLGNDFFQLLF